MTFYDGLELAGVALIVAAAALVYVPLALAVAGVWLITISMLGGQ